jgi:8-oxo-dGTP pyrophosphatase MutT (NUDIX family)
MPSSHPWVVAVAALIYRQGKILAMRRSPRKDAGAGLWETLSGRVEPGEQPYDAVVREIQEECGLQVRVETLPVDAYLAKRNDSPMLVIVYRAEHAGGEVLLSEEHDEYRWLTPAEFAGLTTLTRLAEAVKNFTPP